MAGLAEGVWATLEDLSALWTEDASFQPTLDPALADAAHAVWLRAVDRSRSWAQGTND